MMRIAIASISARMLIMSWGFSVLVSYGNPTYHTTSKNTKNPNILKTCPVTVSFVLYSELTIRNAKATFLHTSITLRLEYL